MVLARGVALKLRAVEIDFAQVAGAVALGFVVEMRVAGMAALTARRHRHGMHLRAEFYDRDKAIAAGAVPFFRSRVSLRPERCQRAPSRRGEADGNAGSGVIKGLNQIAGEPLKAIDVTPRCLPASEILS